MKIFVAGAGGTLGLPVVRRLVRAQADVTCLTRSGEKASLFRQMAARAARADLLDAAAVKRVVAEAAPDAIVQVVNALPKDGPRKPEDLFQTNRLRVEGTAHLLAAAKAAGVRRVVVESFTLAYGFGDLGTAPLAEDAPGSPDAPPAVAALRSLERQAVEAGATVLRFGRFHGAAVPSSRALAEAVWARKVPVPGDGHALASYVHVDDAAEAVLRALERGAPERIYNVVDDEPVSIRDYLEELARAMKAPPPRRLPVWLVKLTAPFAARFLASSAPVSNARAKAELGWAPVYRTYRDALADLGAGVKASRRLAEAAAGRTRL